MLVSHLYLNTKLSYFEKMSLYNATFFYVLKCKVAFLRCFGLFYGFLPPWHGFCT